VASLVPPQKWLRGWPCGSFPFGRRPYADSRVRLTEGQWTHSSGHGDVLSSRVPTVPGMVLQCLGWWHSSGDGRTGPKVTEETRSTGLMSRCCPARARGRRLYLFRGFCRPLSRGMTWGSYGSGRHSVTELTLAFPHSAKDGRIARVGGIASGCDSQAVSEDRRGGNSSFDPGARGVPEHLML
jgi:hypothetical protein